MWAYCLMPNGVHLIVVPASEEVVGRAMGEAHRRYMPALRWTALALFALTVGKLSLIDLRGLGPVYQVLAALGLGAALIGVSFAYHSWLVKREGEDQTTEEESVA